MTPISIPNSLNASISAFDTNRPPSTPKTQSQWKSALQDIKSLYIQRQYKQCAARSSELLKIASGPIHPVYESYLHFYSGISHETLGEAAHKYSKNKLGLLHSALDSFMACSAVLPGMVPIPGPVPELDEEEAAVPSPESMGDFPSPSESEMSCSEIPSSGAGLLSSITSIIDRSIELPDQEDPFVEDIEGCFEPGLFKLPFNGGEKGVLMPSPLHIRKTSSEFGSGSPSFEQAEIPKPGPRIGDGVRVRRPPPLPIKIVPAGEMRRDISTKNEKGNNIEGALLTPSDLSVVKRRQKSEHATPLQSESIMRYNSSIQFLRSRIGSCIADIQTRIDETAEIQHTRRVSKTIRRSASFWSFSPVKDQSCQGKSLEKQALYCGSGQETKEERIARLRGEGWTTVGLKNETRGWKGEEYYREYCSVVMGEMYG